MANKLFQGKPAAPGKVYGAPGAGYSGMISIMTAIVLIALWFLITNLGLITLIFLPSPEAVYHKFIVANTIGIANSTLRQHTEASLQQVLSSFFLALVTACQICIRRGVHRFMRGLFDPIIEFCRPMPPRAHLP